MKKLAILLTLAVAFSLSAFAQTGTSGTSSTSGSTGTETQTTTTKTTKKTKATKADAGETKGAAGSEASGSAKESQLTGCLAKDAAGSGFMLTNGRHKQGVAVTSSEDLSAHVGHEVKLMGTWEKPTSDAAGGGAGPKGHEMRSFTATKVNHIADTCKASAAAAGKKGKKGAAAAEKAPGF
jgi:hypothetical protein